MEQSIALGSSPKRRSAATLQIGNGNDQTQYTINGRKYERFHHISHRINGDGGEGSAIENADLKHHDLDKLFAQLFGYLVEQLSSYTTPTGTLRRSRQGAAFTLTVTAPCSRPKRHGWGVLAPPKRNGVKSAQDASSESALPGCQY